MEKYQISLYGVGSEGEKQLEQKTVENTIEKVIFDINQPNHYSSFKVKWSQIGDSIVDHIQYEPEDFNMDLSCNGEESEYLCILSMKDAELVFKPKDKADKLSIRFMIRMYDAKQDSLFMDAISAIRVTMSPVRDKYKAKYERTRRDYQEILHSTFWRITSVPQKVVDRIRTRNFDLPVAIYKKKGGIAEKRITSIDAQRRGEEENYQFPKQIKFSILVPLYNTPKVFLNEMIASVQAQTYSNWELCLADGSDDAHHYVEGICENYINKDTRIKYMHLKENKGISYNTNECATMATGDFLSLLDHDDMLHPSALYKTMEAICNKDADFVYTDEVTFNGDNLLDIITPHYKSDYAIDTLLANNYICHFTSFKKELFTEVGGFRDKYNGSQDHDLILRITDKAKHVEHVKEILYFWRSHKNSTSKNIGVKSYAIQAGRNAVHDFLEEKGIHSYVDSTEAAKTNYHIHYEIIGTPKISIIIPNKDHYDLIKNCVDSILCKTDYQNYEIIIIDNQSTDFGVLNYYERLKQYDRIKILSYDHPFNFSAINNYAVQSAAGEYVLFLNNDTEVISPEWMTEMLMYAQREDVGAVGAKLIYPNETIQHAGIILGTGEDHVASHAHLGWGRELVGYMGKLDYVSDFMAVTGACLMTKKSLFLEVGGFDEKSFAVAYNDVDLCLKFYELGKTNVYNAFAELYHYESMSRGSDREEKNRKRLDKEVKAFHEKWDHLIEKGDPYYNPNLSDDGLYRVPWFEDK